MKHPLMRVKDESKQLCREISSELIAEAEALCQISITPRFNSLEEFDSWFNSDKPLQL